MMHKHRKAQITNNILPNKPPIFYTPMNKLLLLVCLLSNHFGLLFAWTIVPALLSSARKVPPLYPHDDRMRNANAVRQLFKHQSARCLCLYSMVS